jgi:O-antigen/teichoic acid export membrane protein
LFQLPVNLRGFIILPLLTRTYTQDVYGIWLQILLIKEILIPLLSLRLETALLRYLSIEDNKTEIIKSVFTATFCCSALLCTSIWLFPAPFSLMLFGVNGYLSLLLLSALWIGVLACMQIGLVVLRSKEKIITLSIRELISSLWLIGSVAIAYYIRLDVSRLISLCIIGDTILLIWTMMQIRIPFPILSPIKAFHNVRKYFSYTTPLIFNSLFLWFTKSIDRFLIIHLIGLAAMSVYGVSLQISNLLAIFLSPINYVLFPRVIAAWQPSNPDEAAKYFSQALTITLAFSAPIIVGLLVTSGGLIPLLAGPAYKSSSVLVLFLLSSIFSMMIYQNHLYVIHLVQKTYYLPFLFLFTALMNFCLGYIFVANYGLTGAACAKCITMIIMASAVTIWAKKYITFSLPWMIIIKTTIASILMGFIVIMLPMQTWIQLLVAISSGVIIYLLLLIMLRVISFGMILKYCRLYV